MGSDMNFVKLNDENYEYFKKLIPEQILMRTGGKGSYVIGMVSDKGKLLGAAWYTLELQLQEEKPQFLIRWFTVADKQRKKGYGRQLLEQILSMVEDAGDYYLSVRVPLEHEEVSEFFRHMGFYFIVTQENEINVKLSEVNAVMLKNPEARKYATCTLDEVPDDVYSEKVWKIAQEQMNEKADKMQLSRENYDGFYSRACVIDGRLQGVFLLRKRSDECFEAGYLLCGGKYMQHIAFSLIVDCYRQLLSDFGEELNVRIPLKRSAALMLAEQLLASHDRELVRYGVYLQ